MEREIKFRAWDKQEKKMYQVNKLVFGNILGTVDFLQGDLDGYGLMAAYRTIFMQSTGIKDKNGKEIYEGDIVEILVEETSRKELPLTEEVKWIEELGIWSIFSWLFHIEMFKSSGLNSDVIGLEVIGNIYENPDAL